MSYRVIVWGTGFVGKSVLRDLLDHPNFEIAAVIVNAADKDGKDLGEILGREDTGIHATRDCAAALALEADAVAYFGPNAMHAAVNIENLTASLRAGKNVVDTSMGVFHNPKHTPKEHLDPVAAACNDGGTTFDSGTVLTGTGTIDLAGTQTLSLGVDLTLTGLALDLSGTVTVDGTGVTLNNQSSITLSGDTTKIITAKTCEELPLAKGKTIITTDGTTLLGGDDKAGVAIMMRRPS
ncbi:MAG: hypothetical protein ABGY42_10495 [bacterium]